MELDKELDTYPKYLVENYHKYYDKKIAMRRKNLGIWEEYTWKDVYEKVKYFSMGLISLGLKPEERVSIIGENDLEYYLAIFAVHAAGAIPVGIYTDTMDQELKYYLNGSMSTFMIAHDQEEVDKVLRVMGEVPALKQVIYWDPRGLWFYDKQDDFLKSFDRVLELGKAYDEDHSGLFEENCQKGDSGNTVCFCYTSGTKGLPKAVVITYKQLFVCDKILNKIDLWKDTDNYVSFIPPAWLTEYVLGISGCLMHGMIVNFAERPETVQRDLREIGPEVIFYAARIWESVASEIQAKISDSDWLTRWIYHFAVKVAQRRTEKEFGKKYGDFFWKILLYFLDMGVFRPLRDRIGMSKVRLAYTAGAFLSPDIFRFVRSLGINAKQIYGMTEIVPIAVHRNDDVKPESVGQITSSTEVKINEEGEILVRGEHLFVGYHNDPEATSEALRNGWFHTGDAGYVDENNHLIYWDRVKDLMVLAGGKKFPPQYIEGRLKFSPYIKDVLAIGGADRAFVSVIINIDYENVGKWAEDHGITFTTFSDLSQRPEVYNLILKEVKGVNRLLPEWTRVIRFANLPKQFDADEGEVTRTRKLRRGFLYERYADLIDAIYSNKENVLLSIRVTYQDETMGNLQNMTYIRSVDKV